MKLTKQQRLVLGMLQLGPVKNYQFHRAYVLNYTARISELRAMGFKIPRPEKKKGVATYRLVP